MFKIGTLALGLLSGNVAFSQCVELKNFQFRWEAFKTPMKDGVGGTFKTITTKGFSSRQGKGLQFRWDVPKTPGKGGGGSFKTTTTKNFSPRQVKKALDLFQGASFVIDAKSVDTKNPKRDKNIADNFFHFGTDHSIKGKTLSVTPKELNVEVEFNGVKRAVPMRLTHDKEKKEMKAQGVVDILDFQASKQLKALTQACFKRHEGKTWSDVNVSLIVQYKPCA